MCSLRDFWKNSVFSSALPNFFLIACQYVAEHKPRNRKNIIIFINSFPKSIQICSQKNTEHQDSLLYI